MRSHREEWLPELNTAQKSSETRKRPSYLENMKIFGKISENLFSEKIDLEARLGHIEEWLDSGKIEAVANVICLLICEWRVKSDSPRWKWGLMRFHFFLSVFFFSCMWCLNNEEEGRVNRERQGEKEIEEKDWGNRR